jgi:hypothetical protein
VNPENGAVISDPTPAFDWDTTANATGYQIQVTADSSFDTSSLDAIITESSYLPENALTAGTWYWRVRAHNSCGTYGNWSEERSLTVVPAVPQIENVQVTNLSDTSFSVSWTTDVTTTGYVHFGTTPALGTVAYDDRGSTLQDDTHHVTLNNLSPNTSYFFDIVSGQTVDANGGTHYTVTTGATLPPPAPDTIYGQVYQRDGTHYAGGALVYVQVVDVDSAGSTGSSRWLSTLVDGANGYWYLDLSQVRTPEGTTFAYADNGDTVRVVVEGAAACTAGTEVDTGADTPVETLNLACSETGSLSLNPGWNLMSLPLAPLDTWLAQDWLDDINDQGGSASEVNRWQNGRWDGHIDGLPFNNFAIELGTGYFINNSESSTWHYQGQSLTSGAPLSLQSGWNLIGVPYPTASQTAQSLLDEIAAQGGRCSEIDRWQNGRWDGHIDGLPFNNFTLDPTAGYFLKCTQTSAFTPGTEGGTSQTETWAEITTLPHLTAQATDAPETVRVADLRAVGFSVVWETAAPSTGWVEYGQTEALDQVAYDVQGREYAATIHRATVTGLQPETRYYMRVVNATGATAIQEVWTPPTSGETPGLPLTLYGRVEDGLGRPAAGAVVELTWTDANGHQTQRSTVVDGWGYWSVSVAAEACTGGEVVLAVQGPAGSRVEARHPACKGQPTPTLQLTERTTAKIYLPIITSTSDDS